MKLKDYTTKELHEELKRRELFVRKRKIRERIYIPICKKCKYCIIQKNSNVTLYYCGLKTYTLKNGKTSNYLINFSTECRFNKFEHK